MDKPVKTAAEIYHAADRAPYSVTPKEEARIAELVAPRKADK